MAALCGGCGGGRSAAPAATASSTSSSSSASPSAGQAAQTPLQSWLRTTSMEIAHRGGDRDWPEGTAEAYRNAAAWNPSLALEVPVWRTSDGVWVVSEDRRTGRVFDGDHDIPSTPWSVLATLRTQVGGQPMARLVQDVLDVYGRSRILFVDDKADGAAPAFLDLLDSYGGHARYVVKSFWKSSAVVTLAHQRGYLTWGYYFAGDMAQFAATQQKFDLLGLPWDAPAADFTTAEATGKPVIAHIVSTPAAAEQARAEGARGLMVSDVEAVVPQKPPHR